MLLVPALGLLLLMRSSATQKRTPSPDLTDEESLRIVSSGIFALTPDAMGITFYIHLVNKLSVNLDIATRMWECCESFDEGEVDCTHMHLMGGYKGIICSGNSRNVTLFYPNLYVYNRIGECLVGVWYRFPSGTVKELRTKINFDTSLTPRRVAPTIAAYYEYEATKAEKCAFFDEDPLNKCRPVDCSRKYSGQRLYYSNVERRCLSAPKCNEISSGSRPDGCDRRKRELPNLVYAPEGNICEDLEPIVKEEDIKTMNSGRGVDQDSHPSNEYDFIICHNGNKSHFTGHCNCHDGWSSTASHIRPTTLKVHMCTVAFLTQRYSFDDALTELTDTFNLILPRFGEVFQYTPYSRIFTIVVPLVLTSSICLSIFFAHLYKHQREGEITFRRTTQRSKPGEAQEKRPKLTNNVMRFDEKYEDAYASDDDGSSEMVDIDTDYLYPDTYPGYSDTRNDSYHYADHVDKKMPAIEKAPTSIGFTTKTLNCFRTGGNNACSMSPQEKMRYFGQLQHSDLVPLLQEESQLRSHLTERTGNEYSTETPTIPIKASEASYALKMSRNTFGLKHQEGSQRKSVAPGKLSNRLQNASSLSKSMAQLTYSTLPSSDSLLYLEESGSTSPTQTDDVN